MGHCLRDRVRDVGEGPLVPLLTQRPSAKLESQRPCTCPGEIEADVSRSVWGMKQPQFSSDQAGAGRCPKDPRTPQPCIGDQPHPKHTPAAIGPNPPCYLGCRVDWLRASLRLLFGYQLNFELMRSRTSNGKTAGFSLLAAKALAIALSLRIQTLFCRCLFEAAHQLMQVRRRRLRNLEPNFAAMEARLQTINPALASTGQPIPANSCQIIEDRK